MNNTTCIVMGDGNSSKNASMSSPKNAKMGVGEQERGYKIARGVGGKLTSLSGVYECRIVSIYIGSSWG